MRGFGGMISFLLKGGKEQAFKFLSSCKLAILAESLGGVESKIFYYFLIKISLISVSIQFYTALIEHPASMTHASVPADVRAKLGISDNFIRLSVGIESVEDIMDDLHQALEIACKTA